MHQQPTHLPVPYQQAVPAPYRPYGPPVPHRVAPKNPALHALASAFLLPGLGSMLAGEVGLGFLWAGLFLTSAVTATLLAFTIIGLLIAWIPALGALALWGVSIWHAYAAATKWNTRRGIVS